MPLLGCDDATVVERCKWCNVLPDGENEGGAYENRWIGMAFNSEIGDETVDLTPKSITLDFNIHNTEMGGLVDDFTG